MAHKMIQQFDFDSEKHTVSAFRINEAPRSKLRGIKAKVVEANPPSQARRRRASSGASPYHSSL